MKNKDFLQANPLHVQSTHRDLKKLGIPYFSYGLISQGVVLNSCFSNEEWGNIYREKRYDKIDPLFLGVLRSNFPLIVWDALHPYGKELQVMMERNEVCGIKSGLTLGIKNKNNTEIIALGAENSPKEFYSLLNDEKYIKNIYNIVKKFYQLHKNSSLKQAEQN